jgi:hypothetical protein
MSFRLLRFKYNCVYVTYENLCIFICANKQLSIHYNKQAEARSRSIISVLWKRFAYISMLYINGFLVEKQ